MHQGDEMTFWIGAPNSDKVGSRENREAVVSRLNDVLQTKFLATDEGGVMLTARRLQPGGFAGWGPRVARTYGRKVYWFKSGDERQSYSSTGHLVLVGDAGTGRGWKNRQVALFQEALNQFQSWYTEKGWDPHK